MLVSELAVSLESVLEISLELALGSVSAMDCHRYMRNKQQMPPILHFDTSDWSHNFPPRHTRGNYSQHLGYHRSLQGLRNPWRVVLRSNTTPLSSCWWTRSLHWRARKLMTEKEESGCECVNGSCWQSKRVTWKPPNSIGSRIIRYTYHPDKLYRRIYCPKTRHQRASF